MKIAIQGHPTRGKEVIQILESLGGKNRWFHEGSNSDCYYELHKDCIWCANTRSEYFKYYTIEEFEKEFPFKVGDKVTFLEDDYPYTIKSLSIWSNGNIVCEFKETGMHYSLSKLKLYKEMKEERNITLTLEKAKEWYRKGGELKEVALQAYSEEELTKVDLPRSWEEFCKNYPKQKYETYIGIFSTIESYGSISDRSHIQDKNVCPSEKSAEAHLAMIQLEQLRDCWRQGWEPIWDCSQKWCIRLWGNELGVGVATHFSRFLTFPTNEMAREFLECFRDLIEKARDLI